MTRGVRGFYSPKQLGYCLPREKNSRNAEIAGKNLESLECMNIYKREIVCERRLCKNCNEIHLNIFSSPVVHEAQAVPALNRDKSLWD